VRIRYVHHGIQYASAVPICHVPEIPIVDPRSSVLMVRLFCSLSHLSASQVY